MIIEQTMGSERGDSRRLLTAVLIAIILHIVFFGVLAIVRLAENPNPLPVSVDLAPGTLGGVAFGPGPSARAQQQALQPGRSQAAQSRAGSDQGFVIPTPRQGSSTEGSRPTGPAFREAGNRAGQPSNAQEATSPVQEPVFPSSKASQQGTGPATTGGGARSGAPARGVGVLVEGGGNAPAKGSLDLGSFDASAAGARGSGGPAGSEEGGGGGGPTVASGGGGQGGYRVQWDQPEAGQARKLLASPQPKIPLWVSKEGLSLTVLIAFTLTPDGILRDVNIEGSSGYNEVDAAVSEAIRHWRFSADPSARSIHGMIPYLIRAR